MLFIYRFLAAGVILLIAAGCASTKLITEYDAADAFPLAKDTTVWHFFWGLQQASPIRPDCDPTFNYLSQVRVRTTPGQVILSFLTLGIVLPQRISWSCGVYNPEPGTPGSPGENGHPGTPNTNDNNDTPGSPGSGDSTHLKLNQ